MRQYRIVQVELAFEVRQYRIPWQLARLAICSIPRELLQFEAVLTTSTNSNIMHNIMHEVMQFCRLLRILQATSDSAGLLVCSSPGELLQFGAVPVEPYGMR